MEKKTDNRETEGLKGPVKEIKHTFHKAHKKADEIIAAEQIIMYEEEKKNYLYGYNEKGNLIRNEILTRIGMKKNIYDDEGNEIEDSNYNDKGELQWKHTYSYNAQGIMQEMQHYNWNEKREEKLTFKFIYEHDAKGNNIKSHKYKPDGSLELNCHYAYNDKAEMIECKHISPDGTITLWCAKAHDDNGDLIQEKHFNPDGSLKSSSLWLRDEEGKLMEIKYLNADGSLKSSQTYPRSSSEEEEEEEEKEKDLYKYKQEEDKSGNWIKKTSFYKEMPVNIRLRQITYYGEPSEKEELHLSKLPTAIPIAIGSQLPTASAPLTAEQIKFLTETTNAENFPLVRYYGLHNDCFPSQTNFNSQNIEARTLLRELMENMNAHIIHIHSYTYGSYEVLQKYTLAFPHKGYLLQSAQLSSVEDETYKIPEFMKTYGSVHLANFTLLRPSDDSGKRDKVFEKELEDYINKCALDKKPEKPEIYMIEMAKGEWSLESHPAEDKFQIKDLDLNYGYGFEKFHNELMKRFKSETKGLVLFHGQPGTGKTYYIRHLLRKMANSGKIVIYMPPSMVEHLTEPGFITFLTNEVTRWSDEGYFCVLLIEDAEPLLAARQQGVEKFRIQGVTNLLNMTDGLLNDILNIQIICTFNVDLTELDSALLRPGRLLARKEFKPLDELDANVLAQRLKIKHTFSAPATLSEIYALIKNKNTLLHDIKKKGPVE